MPKKTPMGWVVGRYFPENDTATIYPYGGATLEQREIAKEALEEHFNTNKISYTMPGLDNWTDL